MKLPLKASLVWAWLLLLALLPTNNLLWPLLLLASLLLPFPTWTLLLLFPLKLLPLLLDPLLDSLGYWWLTWAPLQPLWAALQRFPLLPLMGYDHSLVAGSLLIATLLWSLSLVLLLTGRALSLRIRERSFPDAPQKVAPAYRFKYLPSRVKRPFSQLKMKHLLRPLSLAESTELRALFEEEGSGFRVRFPLNRQEGKTLHRLYWRSRYLYWQKRRISLLMGLFLTGGLLFIWAKDAWLQERISRQLERWHGAQVDLTGFSLRLLKGRIAFDSLQVTDPNNPSYNLVQLGPSQLDIKPGELLRGRLVIEVMESLNSAFNAPRKKEGRVSQRSSASPEGQEPPSPWQFELPQINPDALLIKELDQLTSVKLLQHLQQYYQQRLFAWKPIGEQRQSELIALQQTLDQVFRQQPSDWVNSEALQKRQEQLETLRIRSHNLISQSQEDITALSIEIADLNNSWETLRLQIDRDLASLTQRLTAQALLGSLQPLVGQIAAQQIHQLWQRYPQLQQFNRLRLPRQVSIAQGATQKKFWFARRGRRVLFSAPGILPRFYAQRLTFSRGQEQSNDFLLLELRNLSSRPQLVVNPITAHWRSIGPEGSSSTGKLVLDLHSPVNPSTLHFIKVQQPLVLGPTYFGAEAPISYYRASAQYELEASWQNTLINAALRANILTEKVDSKIPLLEELLRAMLLEKKIQLVLSLEASENKPLHLVSTDSNIDQLALPTWEKLKTYLLRQAEKRLEELLSHRMRQLWASELRDPVAEQLKQLLPSLADNSDLIGQKLLDLNAEKSRLQQLGRELLRAADAKLTTEKNRLTDKAATELELLGQQGAAAAEWQKNKLLKSIFPPP